MVIRSVSLLYFFVCLVIIKPLLWLITYLSDDYSARGGFKYADNKEDLQSTIKSLNQGLELIS